MEPVYVWRIESDGVMELNQFQLAASEQCERNVPDVCHLQSHSLSQSFDNSLATTDKDATLGKFEISLHLQLLQTTSECS